MPTHVCLSDETRTPPPEEGLHEFDLSRRRHITHLTTRSPIETESPSEIYRTGPVNTDQANPGLSGQVPLHCQIAGLGVLNMCRYIITITITSITVAAIIITITLLVIIIATHIIIIAVLIFIIITVEALSTTESS